MPDAATLARSGRHPMCRYAEPHAPSPAGEAQCRSRFNRFGGVRPRQANARKRILLGDTHGGLIGIDFMVETKQVQDPVDEEVAHLTGDAVAVEVGLFLRAWHRYGDVTDVCSLRRRATSLKR